MTRDRLFQVFVVDLDGGRLHWRQPSKFHNEKAGREAGCAWRSHSGKQYWHVKIDGRTYKRGRLIFFLAHGRFPSPCLDHINGNSLDDRLANIREATITQNAWNHKRRAKRSLLPMGVRLISASGRYQARIAFNKSMIHLGAYDTPAEAAFAYQAKRRELYGHFA